MSSSEEEVFVFPPPRPLPSPTSLESDVSRSYSDEVEYTNCRMEELPCFHDGISRNTAEILLDQEKEGSFLIRPSTVIGNCTVSVRSAKSVRHFQIAYDGERYSFGQALFWSPFQIWDHLNQRPVLECDEGVKVQLKQPYLNELPETDVKYSTVGRHWLPEETVIKPQKTTATIKRYKSSIGSDSTAIIQGQLHKKKEGKKWKTRWCVLEENFFSYYKNKKASNALNYLDLRQALEVKDDYDENDRKNSFRIVFPNIYFIFSSDSAEDKDMWFGNIKCQIDANKVPGLE